MVLPLPRTSISLGTGAECFLAHAGSASMASGLRAGAFPSKVTVPVTDEAATATPGQTDTATSPAASHNLFPVRAHARLLGHCLRGGLRPAAPPYTLARGGPCAPLRSRGSLVVPRSPVQDLRRDCVARALSTARTCAARSGQPQTFSNASDSASLGSRSGTSACRRISQLAAATKHPPTATSAATSRADGRSPSGWSVGMTCQ